MQIRKKQRKRGDFWTDGEGNEEREREISGQMGKKTKVGDFFNQCYVGGQEQSETFK